MKKEETIGAIAVITVIAVVGYIIYKSVEAKEIEGDEMDQVKTGQRGWLADVGAKGTRTWTKLTAIIALKRDRPFITEWIEQTVIFPRTSPIAEDYLQTLQRAPEDAPYAEWYRDLMKRLGILPVVNESGKLTSGTKGMTAIWRYGKSDDYTTWKKLEWAYGHGYIDGLPTTLTKADPYYKQYLEWWADVIKRGDSSITDAISKWIIEEADKDSLQLGIWHYTVTPILEEKATGNMAKMFSGQDIKGLSTPQLALWMRQWTRKWSSDAVVEYLKSLGYSQGEIDKAIAESGMTYPTAKDQAGAKKKGGQYGINPSTGKPYTAQEYYGQVYKKRQVVH